MEDCKGGITLNPGKDLFKNIEKKTGVNMNDVFKIADSVKNANLKDEKTVRNLVKQVAQAANKPVSKQKEDKIVEAIVNNSSNLDFSTIAKMLDNKK